MKNVKLRVIQGDITNLGFSVDAIVNAANKFLSGGGGGVDGAIHSVCDDCLSTECAKIIETKGVLTEGDVVITDSCGLDSDFILHAVGPKIIDYPTDKQAEQLKLCYFNAILLADKKGCKSIAFPNISTGVYNYPKEEAYEKAMAGINQAISVGLENIRDIYFICYDNENYEIYVLNLENLNLVESLNDDIDFWDIFPCYCCDCEGNEEDFDDSAFDEEDFDEEYLDEEDLGSLWDKSEDFEDTEVEGIEHVFNEDLDEEIEDIDFDSDNISFSGFEFECLPKSRPDRVAEIVKDMVSKVEQGDISKLEIEVEKEEKTNALKIELELIID